MIQTSGHQGQIKDIEYSLGYCFQKIDKTLVSSVADRLVRNGGCKVSYRCYLGSRKEEWNQSFGDPYGNRLIKKSEYGDNHFYWCGRKDIKCPVRVTLNSKVNELVSGRGEHNHDSDRMLQVINNDYKQIIINK